MISTAGVEAGVVMVGVTVVVVDGVYVSSTIPVERTEGVVSAELVPRVVISTKVVPTVALSTELEPSAVISVKEVV